MQFPESWLREFCSPDLNTKELADLLTMAGLEVEDLRPVAPAFTGVVVAEILEAVQHPNADRLRVCKVTAGNLTPEPLQIVCGAPNARVGIRVPLAMVGAVLPPGDDGKPFTINVGKLRGVESFGMLCAADELGLSEDHGGLLELAADAPVGANLRDYLTLDDTLFTLKLTPNLAHALSVYGVAREVSALTGAPLKVPSFPPVAVTHQTKLPVAIQAPDLCGRFTGRVIQNVNHKAKTPDWMVRRLERCGQRSVSILVDISNYVMFEYGRPNHIFDFDKIHGGLNVRWAKKGETLELLSGKTVELDEKVGVVADHGAVESLAGIMGGERTSVTDATKSVYVEAAFWFPDAVAGRSRRFNFATEAGHRFERGVDPAQTVEHVEHITRLIVDLCGGSAGPIDDQVAATPERKPVTLRVARAAQVIGMPVTADDCRTVLTRLGLTFTEAQGTFTVTPPSWRFDMTIEEDLIEEVVRVIGYNKLPETAPVAPLTPRLRAEVRRSPHALRRAAADRGYQETVNYAFVEERWETELAGNPNPVRLLNPIAAPLAVMRSSLLGSLVQVLRYNLARRADRVRVFELGRVFHRDSSVTDTLKTVAGIAQPLKIAGLAYGSVAAGQWGIGDRPVDFYDVKGDVEALLGQKAVFVAANHPALHPGRSARIEVAGQVVGWVGELHPQWRQSYELPASPVVFELDADAVMNVPVPRPQGLPKHHPALRDLALVVPSAVTADALLGALKASDKTGLLKAVSLFDVYRMSDVEKSLALRLEVLDPEAPLTEEKITSVVNAAVAAAERAVGARLRS